MSKNEQMVGISRRTLVKSTAIGSLALAAGGFSLPFTLRSAEAAVQQANEKVVWGACSVNCGSRCALRLHVKDNEVTWVETDNTGSDEYGNHQVRACLRGRSIRRRINHPDRLNYPMKRVGKRGEGKFERISWDEALDTIASSLKKTVKQYGNEGCIYSVLFGDCWRQYDPLFSISLGGQTPDELLRRFTKSVWLLQHCANFLCHALHLRQ